MLLKIFNIIMITLQVKHERIYNLLTANCKSKLNYFTRLYCPIVSILCSLLFRHLNLGNLEWLETFLTPVIFKLKYESYETKFEL